MNVVFKGFALGIMAGFLLSGPCIAASKSASPPSETVIGRQDAEPVRKLRGLYASNQEFRKLMEAALANVQDQPDGTPNPWKGKRFNDLCTFFNEWFSLVPVNNDP